MPNNTFAPLCHMHLISFYEKFFLFPINLEDLKSHGENSSIFNWYVFQIETTEYFNWRLAKLVTSCTF